jgi:hypothetical protein
VQDRISKLEAKIEIKEKPEELLVKQLKICERNMEELIDCIKRPNLSIMMQAKGICNMFNKIITENFPNLKKVLPIQVQEESRT